MESVLQDSPDLGTAEGRTKGWDGRGTSMLPGGCRAPGNIWACLHASWHIVSILHIEAAEAQTTGRALQHSGICHRATGAPVEVRVLIYSMLFLNTLFVV